MAYVNGKCNVMYVWMDGWMDKRLWKRNSTKPYTAEYNGS
jgi:hypothetical protein